MFTEKDANDLFAVIPNSHMHMVHELFGNPTTPRERLRMAFIIAYFEAKCATDRIREHKRQKADWMDRVNKFLNEKP